MVNEGTNHFGIHDSELFEMDEKFDFQFQRTTLEFESFCWAAPALNCVVYISRGNMPIRSMFIYFHVNTNNICASNVVTYISNIFQY